MPKKAYIIIHDGINVLVGMGGRSGRNKQIRRGYHLPGGSINGYESIEVAIQRELDEETGIDIRKLVVEGSVTSDNAPGVTFIVAKAKDVNKLVKDFERPEVTSGHDEPYETLMSLKSEGSWLNKNFNEEAFTDWFAWGLMAAKGYIIHQ